MYLKSKTTGSVVYNIQYTIQTEPKRDECMWTFLLLLLLLFLWCRTYNPYHNSVLSQLNWDKMSIWDFFADKSKIDHSQQNRTVTMLYCTHGTNFFSRRFNLKYIYIPNICHMFRCDWVKKRNHSGKSA